MQRKLQEDAAAKWLQKYTAAAAAGSKAAAASPGVPATGGPAAAGVDDAPSSQFSGQSTFTAAPQSMAAAAEAAQPLGLLARCLCAKARPQQQQRQQRSVLLQTAAAPAVQLVAQPQPPRHVVQTGAGTDSVPWTACHAPTVRRSPLPPVETSNRAGTHAAAAAAAAASPKAVKLLTVELFRPSPTRLGVVTKAPVTEGPQPAISNGATASALSCQTGGSGQARQQQRSDSFSGFPTSQLPPGLLPTPSPCATDAGCWAALPVALSPFLSAPSPFIAVKSAAVAASIAASGDGAPASVLHPLPGSNLHLSPLSLPSWSGSSCGGDGGLTTLSGGLGRGSVNGGSNAGSFTAGSLNAGSYDGSGLDLGNFAAGSGNHAAFLAQLTSNPDAALRALVGHKPLPASEKLHAASDSGIGRGIPGGDDFEAALRRFSGGSFNGGLPTSAFQGPGRGTGSVSVASEAASSEVAVAPAPPPAPHPLAHEVVPADAKRRHNSHNGRLSPEALSQGAAAADRLLTSQVCSCAVRLTKAFGWHLSRTSSATLLKELHSALAVCGQVAPEGTIKNRGLTESCCGAGADEPLRRHSQGAARCRQGLDCLYRLRAAHARCRAPRQPRRHLR